MVEENEQARSLVRFPLLSLSGTGEAARSQIRMTLMSDLYFVMIRRALSHKINHFQVLPWCIRQNKSFKITALFSSLKRTSANKATLVRPAIRLVVRLRRGEDRVCTHVSLKPRLNGKKCLSNMVFVTQNVRWLNGQTMFDQTLDNGKPFKCKVERGG